MSIGGETEGMSLDDVQRDIVEYVRAHYGVQVDEIPHESTFDDLGLDPLVVLLMAEIAEQIPDVIGPGHASRVHAELGYGPLEIATAHGICSSGIMALKNAYLQVAMGEKRNAISVGSEFASRIMKSSRYEDMGASAEDGSLPLEVAFLRYMLSDGAGAVVIESEPATATGSR